MHRWTELYAPLIGRIFMGGYFLWSGIQEGLNFPSTVATLAQAGMPNPEWIGALGILLEVLCGIALIVGSKTRMAALVLAIYMMASAFLYNGLGSDTTLNLFLQNLAIVGGLLYMSAYGSKGWNTDWRRR